MNIIFGLGKGTTTVIVPVVEEKVTGSDIECVSETTLVECTQTSKLITVNSSNNTLEIIR
jgi:hypothetical protein